MIMMSMLCFVSCLEDHTDTLHLVPGINDSGLSSDYLADENPQIGNANASIPNVYYTIEGEGDDAVVRLDMTGIQNPATRDWVRLIGTAETGTNVWLCVDCQPKYIQVYNTIDDVDETIVAKNDIVFLVDNSGSMDAEADAIARDIVSWSKSLTSKFDVCFGCVGYNGLITGAINMTTVENVSQYLNRSSGIDRTFGFSGSDASRLKSAAYSYDLISQEECGVAALRYADENFTFRQGANRIYINFTDEPNQPGGKSGFSVRYLESQTTWPTTKGTIHTVYSGSTSFTESSFSREKPWKMSDYTGGTTLYTSGSFSGVSLQNLPVTSAIQNSYIIRFSNISEFMDGKSHEIKITVYAEDGAVRAERRFYINFGSHS